MKILTQTKLKVLGILILLALTLNISAQVTIGADRPAVDGALLQLLEYTPSSANQNANRGLNLPRVSLLDVAGSHSGQVLVNTLGMTGVTLTDAEAKLHEGLIVYNVNTATISNTNFYTESKICPGVYVWIGDKWARAMITACK